MYISKEPVTVLTRQQQNNSRSLALLWQGYRATMPFMIGVIPFGIVFGAVAVAAGLRPGEAVWMSILVFAGSSQFMAVKLIESGASILLIVVTTFFINLRNFLYSASLAPSFRPLQAGWKWLLAYPMADEVYATVLLRARQGDLLPRELAWYAAGVSLNLIGVWWGSTAIGALLGNILPGHLAQTLGFIAPLIFISLVAPLLTTRPALLAALAAGLASATLAPLPNHLGLLLAAAAGIAVGLAAEKWNSKGGTAA